MNSLNKKKNFRWVLLRHTFAPGDVEEAHYDFLIEDEEFCRTWRLSNIPVLNGPYVDSLHSHPHNLYWLDIERRVVSGNRGVATRIKQGIILDSLPLVENNFINLSLEWDGDKVVLVIDEKGCRVLKKRY